MLRTQGACSPGTTPRRRVIRAQTTIAGARRSPGETEFAYHEIVGELIDSPYRWKSVDFLTHLYAGGAPVSLSEIGHLNDIAAHYAHFDGEKGAFRRLSDQIVEAAREQGSGSFRYPFDKVYDFTEGAMAESG